MIVVIVIFLLFAVLHSVTASQKFKQRCLNIFGDRFMRVFYRLLYIALSALSGAAALAVLVRVPDRRIWTAPPALALLLRAVQLAGFAFGVLGFRHLDGAEFLGIRQVWRYFRTKEAAGNIEGLTQEGLVTAGVYGLVRHPLYLAGLVIFTFNPRLTVNGLTLAVLADLYFLFGMFIEERRFLGVFGDEYRGYMERVPRVVPRLPFRRA